MVARNNLQKPFEHTQRRVVFVGVFFLIVAACTNLHLYFEDVSSALLDAIDNDVNVTAVRLQILDDPHRAYELAMERYFDRQRTLKFQSNITSLDDVSQSDDPKRQVLNLIRFPKCGSSYIAKAARSLAGCHPEGFTCCNRQWDVCPRQNTICKLVRGCVNHYPNYEGGLPTIAMFRDPASRLLSGFFYERPHRPHDQCFSYACFEEDYIPNISFKNALTKMLVGFFPYKPAEMKSEDVAAAKNRLCTFSWIGMIDMPVASQLLLYEAEAFRILVPNPVVFDLPPLGGYIDDGLTNWNLSEGSLRKNEKLAYSTFKTGEYARNNGHSLIMRHNIEDFEVYHFARGLFCARIQESGLLEHARKYNLLHHFSGCRGFNNTGNLTEVHRVDHFCPPVKNKTTSRL